MRRREFITLLGGVAVPRPVRARAQQAKKPIRIGLLPFGSPSNAYDQSLVDAFRSGLRQAGLIEGPDIVLDIVWTTGSDADTDKAVTDLIAVSGMTTLGNWPCTTFFAQELPSKNQET